MQDRDKTKEQLIREITALRQRIAEVEARPLTPEGSLEGGADRKRAERALRESEELYRTLVKTLPDAVTVTDLEGRITFASPRTLELHGFESEEQLLGRSALELIAPQDRERATANMLVTLQEGLLRNVEYTFLKKDGTPFAGGLNAALIQDTQGAPKAFIAVTRDITEHKRLEQQIQERRLYLESVLACAPDAIVTMDAHHHILEWNQGAEKLFGYTAEEVIGRDLDQMIAAADARMLEQAIAFTQRTLAGESVLPTGTIRYRKDGTPVDVILAAAPIFVQDTLAGTVAVYTDVTERRQLKEFSEGIVQNMAEGIAIQDTEGYLTFVNPAAAALLGYTAEELLDQHWTLVVPPDQQPIVRAADERRVRGQADRYEVELLCRDGRRIPVLISGSPRFSADTGQFAGTLAVFTDISARVRAEERLTRYAQEMAALYETSLEINAQPDLPTLLHAIVERAAGLLGARMGGLYLVRPDGETLELVIAHNMPHDLVGTVLRFGEGLSGRVAQSGEPLMVPDYREWEGHAEAYAGHPFRRVLGVPLRLRDQVIGVINVTDDERTGPFDDDEIRLVGLFADQAAIAVENARLLEAEAHRRREAETLQAATQALTATLDLQQVFELILRELRQVVPYDSASVQQLKGDQLEIIGGHGFPNPEELLGVSFDLKAQDNPNHVVIRTRAPFILEDAPVVYSEFKRAPHALAGIRSWLGVPLLFGDRLIGMIALDKREPGFYTEDHARLVMAFAAQAAIAIENARLFEAQRNQRILAEVLREAGRVMGTSLELGEILRLILDQLKRVLIYDAASVLILREGDLPDLVVGVGYADERLTSREAGVLLRDSPILRRMAHDLQPVVSVDVRQLEGWIWVPGTEHVRSWLGIPLVVHDRMIGALMVDHSQPGFYGEAELQIAQDLAQHAAQAIENARLFQAEREQRELAEALRQATAAVSSTLDLDQVLDHILEQVKRVVPSDAANVSLIEDGRTRMVRWRGYERYNGDIPSITLSVADTPGLRQMKETGETLIVSDTATYPGWVPLPEVAWLRSYAGVPIRVRDQVIGFLNVDSATPGFFKPADADRLRAFADQASLALGNARLFEEMSRRAGQMATLNRIGLAITTDLNLEEVLNTLYEQIERIMDVGAFYVALYEEKTGLIHFPLLTGVTGPGTIEPLDIHGESGLTGYIIRSGKPLYLPDTLNLPAEAPYSPIWLIDQPARSYVGVPLTFRERVIGVLSIQSYEPGAYTEADIELLTTIATQATVAIENARLYDEARRRNQDLALLNRVIAASATGQTGEQILEAISRELALYLDLPHSSVTLFNNEKTEAVIVAEYLAQGGPSMVGKTISIEGMPAAQYLLEHRVPLIVADAQTDPRFAAIHDLVRQCGNVSLLVLPLIVEGEVVGSLEVDAMEPRSFAAEEVELARRVADQVSSALDRARLEETQRRLSTAVEQAAEGVLITDTEGTILYVNPAFERIVGYSHAEVIGHDFSMLRASHPDRTHHQEWWQTVTAEEVWQERVSDVRKDGIPYTLDLTVSPVRNQAGEIVNYVGTMRDITREVKLEEQFQQAQKMEALGRLAGGIAHDFNNLLTVIRLSIRLLERQLHPEDPLWEHVQRIEETSERAAKLTKQLLSFSRRGIIELRLLKLNEVVHDLNRMLQRIIGEDIELVTRLAEDLWPAKVDPAQMEQLIMNLVVNARDAMPSGGTLTIETSNQVIDEAYAASLMDVQAGEYVLLCVKDTGIGMDDEVKAHLFEPFFTTKDRGQGTGLGLPIVFGIVKLHEGHIQVDSEVGQGTTFRIYLPRAHGPVSDVRPMRDPEPRTMELEPRTETLLVVEDEPAVRDLAVRVLTPCGYQVLAASDGHEALEISAQHQGPIHLLLTDVVLPRMNGKELADRLRAERPETRVIYMSGYTDDAITHHGVLAPDTAFLSKPFSMETLIAKVRTVLDSPV